MATFPQTFIAFTLFQRGYFSFSSLLLWELVYDKTDLEFGLLNRGLCGDFFKSEVITHKGYYSKCMTRSKQNFNFHKRPCSSPE